MIPSSQLFVDAKVLLETISEAEALPQGSHLRLQLVYLSKVKGFGRSLKSDAPLSLPQPQDQEDYKHQTWSIHENRTTELLQIPVIDRVLAADTFTVADPVVFRAASEYRM